MRAATCRRENGRRRLVLALVSVSMLLGACNLAPMRPDLARLYRVSATTADTTPLIVIPGIFGSKLRDRTTGVEVWPGKSTDVLWSDYAHLARETLDPSAPQSEDSFLPVAYWFFLCEQHDQLTNNVNFQDNLLNVLLMRSLPWEMTDTK